MFNATAFDPLTGQDARMKTVLVMDDDECMRELLRLHLRNAGYEVLEAEDAVAAGHLLLKRRPDILLAADVERPYMSGLELVEAMRADPATCAVPVIFITCRPDAEPRARALGAAALLAKPLHVDHLLAIVAEHLEPPTPA
jgi:two-component system chemotaxis response regulator CheY